MSKIIKFRLPCQFQFLYQTLRVFSRIKDRKHIKQNVHSVARIMPLGLDLGVLGEVKTLAWGFGMAPHRHSVLVLCFCYFVMWCPGSGVELGCIKY